MRDVPFGRFAGLSLLLLAACGGPAKPTPAKHMDRPSAIAMVRDAHCSACHDVGDALRDDLRGSPPRSLAALGAMVDPSKPMPRMRNHYAGEAAADVVAWMHSLAPARAQLATAELPAGAVEFGQRLVEELACGACHSPRELDLGAKTDHATLSAFLREPSAVLPDLAHVPLSRGEANAVAAWLLRSQEVKSAAEPGFGYECFEMQIENGDLPDLTGRKPSVSGVVQAVDVESRTRDNHFAMRFHSTLRVPATGDWKFIVGSDDGSWLWIDGELLIDNGGMKPHKRKNATVRLTAGPHELQVVYTQGSGGQSLELLWQGPGVERQPIPGTAAEASITRLVPPQRAQVAIDAAAVERGRVAARAARCDNCHAVADDAFHALPAPAKGKPWSELADGACAMPAGPNIFQEVGELPAGGLAPATRLKLQMVADGCTKCHVRDGVGGLPNTVKSKLTEVEDMGDEGILPPDLTSVGRRLRPEWLQKVIREGHKARDYVRMRMPAYGAEKAKAYAALFAEVDAPGLVDEEVEFSTEAAELGRTLVGIGGRNCITCHTAQGHAALGIQGMDLLAQNERLRPGWLHDWLREPTTLRPQTRMPQLWIRGDEQDEREIAAIRAWMSLGQAAPLPKGVIVDPSSNHLVPADGPILHGAFLRDVSARCLCVGTPERTHFAYDLAKPRLAWLWRGGFVDSALTWNGRAGKLVKPLGKDWIVLDDFTTKGAAERRMLGQKRTPDGYPILRVAVGENDGLAYYEDQCRAELRRGGSALVRTIRCTKGKLELRFPPVDGLRVLVDGEAGSEHTLAEGQSLEVVYEW